MLLRSPPRQHLIGSAELGSSPVRLQVDQNSTAGELGTQRRRRRLTGRPRPLPQPPVRSAERCITLAARQR